MVGGRHGFVFVLLLPADCLFGAQVSSVLRTSLVREEDLADTQTAVDTGDTGDTGDANASAGTDLQDIQLYWTGCPMQKMLNAAPADIKSWTVWTSELLKVFDYV